MTPCEELGYKVGDRFKAIFPCHGWKKDQIITLFRDDGSNHPLFEGEGCHYNNADGKPGAYFGLAWVKKVTRKKCRRHKRSRKFKASK